jgi:hypothetical protein
LRQKESGQACSSLIEADENHLGESMLARFAFDIAARRLLADRQAIYRQRKEPEMIMVRAMTAPRTWAAMAESPEIIDGLLEACLFGLIGAAEGKGRPVGRNEGRRVKRHDVASMVTPASTGSGVCLCALMPVK